MFGLFPKTPFMPAAGQGTMPICEWVMPAPIVRRREYFSTYRRCRLECPKIPKSAGVAFFGLSPGHRFSAS